MCDISVVTALRVETSWKHMTCDDDRGGCRAGAAPSPRPLPIAAAAEDIVPAQLCTALTGDSVYLAFSPKLTLLRSQFWKFWTLILGYICFFAPNFGHGRVVSAAPHSPINLPELKSNCCKNQKPPETEFDIQMVEDYRKYLLKICTYAILAQP